MLLLLAVVAIIYSMTLYLGVKPTIAIVARLLFISVIFFVIIKIRP